MNFFIYSYEVAAKANWPVKIVLFPLIFTVPPYQPTSGLPRQHGTNLQAGSENQRKNLRFFQTKRFLQPPLI